MSGFEIPASGPTSVILESLKVGLQAATGQYVAESAQIQRHEDFELGQLVTRLTARVLAAKTVADSRTYAVHHPATWWQHLKHSHGPTWFTRRYPVRFETTTVTADFTQYATYPKANIRVPADQFGYPVIVQMADSSIDSRWDWDRRVDEPQEPQYMKRHELIYRLCRDVAASGPAGPIHPGQAQAVLEVLAALGVNPDELVRAEP